MAFTDQQLIDIRRFCGYPLYGNTAQPNTSYRFFDAYGVLEYRMANATANEQTTVINSYLTPLYTLETAITGAGANLTVDTAGPFKRNMSEVDDRFDLFNRWRLRLCKYFGVAPGPDIEDSTSVSIIV